MSVRSGQSVALCFVTSHPTTHEGGDADSLPSGTLFLNGAPDGATVVESHLE